MLASGSCRTRAFAGQLGEFARAEPERGLPVGRRIGGALSGGLIGLLVCFAAITLLFAGRYPRGLYNLVIGMNRWVVRVIAYAALMTDAYPPFRLDQGGTGVPAPAPDDLAPASAASAPTPAAQVG